mmetsp:Transcript_2269/g.2213  ORF Transcript_2269/g.2213 Transcript_2269/m.2213 type:complete len:92 (-) Transcript_2269:121-396(-)
MITAQSAGRDPLSSSVLLIVFAVTAFVVVCITSCTLHPTRMSELTTLSLVSTIVIASTRVFRGEHVLFLDRHSVREGLIIARGYCHSCRKK